ncbi:MAG: hypothetical protein WA705_06865 [Candidatus Ozemobacteraceae bacterium]
MDTFTRPDRKKMRVIIKIAIMTTGSAPEAPVGCAKATAGETSISTRALATNHEQFFNFIFLSLTVRSNNRCCPLQDPDL